MIATDKMPMADGRPLGEVKKKGGNRPTLFLPFLLGRL